MPISDIPPSDNPFARDDLPIRRASRCGADSDGPRSECRKGRNSRVRASPRWARSGKPTEITGSLPGSFTFSRSRCAQFNRKKLVVHLKTRLKGKTVDGRDVRKKRKPQRRLGCQILGHREQVLAGNDDGGFAPGFNDLRDGLARPTPGACARRRFSRFPVIPLLLSDSGGAINDPNRGRPSSRGRCNQQTEL